MATENISIIMLERMWDLLSGIVADKTGTADAKLEAAIAAANTAEALVELLPDDEQTALWNAVSKRAAAAASTLMPRVGEVCVQLFDMSGHKLGEVQS